MRSVGTPRLECLIVLAFQRGFNILYDYFLNICLHHQLYSHFSIVTVDGNISIVSIE